MRSGFPPCMRPGVFGGEKPQDFGTGGYRCVLGTVAPGGDREKQAGCAQAFATMGCVPAPVYLAGVTVGHPHVPRGHPGWVLLPRVRCPERTLWIWVGGAQRKVGDAEGPSGVPTEQGVSSTSPDGLALQFWEEKGLSQSIQAKPWQEEAKTSKAGVLLENKARKVP